MTELQKTARPLSVAIFQAARKTKKKAIYFVVPANAGELILPPPLAGEGGFANGSAQSAAR
jgi:hypothetical protein